MKIEFKQFLLQATRITESENFTFIIYLELIVKFFAGLCLWVPTKLDTHQKSKQNFYDNLPTNGSSWLSAWSDF